MRAEPQVKESLRPALVDLRSLPRGELEAMAEAGAEILEILRVLKKTEDNVVGELLRGQGTFYEWDHYPPGDVYDHDSHSQFYYHAHPIDQRFKEEHGHFHTFLRPKGMPPGIRPAPLADYAPPEDPNDALSHLIAISMDAAGLPFRLFTVNRWVTGEVWYSADDVCALLDHFKIDHTQPSWPTNRWVTAMVALYKPQIRELVRARDRFVADWHDSHPGEAIYENRDVEVTSLLDISLEEQIREVGAVLA